MDIQISKFNGVQEVPSKEDTGGLETEQVYSSLAYGTGTPPPQHTHTHRHTHNPCTNRLRAGGSIDVTKMEGAWRGRKAQKLRRPRGRRPRPRSVLITAQLETHCVPEGRAVSRPGRLPGSARVRAFGRPSFEAGVVSGLECLELWVGELG